MSGKVDMQTNNMGYAMEKIYLQTKRKEDGSLVLTDQHGREVNGLKELDIVQSYNEFQVLSVKVVGYCDTTPVLWK